MVLDVEIHLQGFFPSQHDGHSPTTNLLQINWNRRRRVFSAILPPQDVLVGSPASAQFDVRFGSVSDLNSQIWRSLSSLNFRPVVRNFLCPKITDYAAGIAAARPGPPYPSTVIVANLNFIEKHYIQRPSVFSQFRQWAASFLPETFAVGTSSEETSGGGDLETAGDEETGVSDSAIDILRRRRFEWRGGGEEKCSICLETFSDGEEVFPLRCEHVYHESCILPWLKKSRSCPLCRRET